MGVKKIYSRIDDLLQECVVLLRAGTSQGSGFFIAPRKIVTCAHVVANKPNQTIHVQWKKLNNQVISFNATLYKNNFYIKEDIAVLHFDSSPETNNHPCVLLDDFEPRLHSQLYCFGYSANTDGDSSTFNYEGRCFINNLLMYKLKQGQAKPGLSGSPILDENTGAVCGIMAISRNISSDIGARIIPVSILFSHFPDIQKENQNYHKQYKTWLEFISFRNPESKRKETVFKLLSNANNKMLLDMQQKWDSDFYFKPNNTEAGDLVYFHFTKEIFRAISLVSISSDDVNHPLSGMYFRSCAEIFINKMINAIDERDRANSENIRDIGSIMEKFDEYYSAANYMTPYTAKGMIILFTKDYSKSFSINFGFKGIFFTKLNNQIKDFANTGKLLGNNYWRNSKHNMWITPKLITKDDLFYISTFNKHDNLSFNDYKKIIREILNNSDSSFLEEILYHPLGMKIRTGDVSIVILKKL